MTQYDIGFAQRFAREAQGMVERGLDDGEAHRVAAYLSRVSMELSLKAFLESAGKPVSEIRRYSHDLAGLLAEVDRCEVEVEISPGVRQWVPASRLRAVTVDVLGGRITAGKLLEAEAQGASTFPNELRYGVPPKDYPAAALAAGAVAIGNWVQQSAHVARVKR